MKHIMINIHVRLPTVDTFRNLKWLSTILLSSQHQYLAIPWYSLFCSISFVQYRLIIVRGSSIYFHLLLRTSSIISICFIMLQTCDRKWNTILNRAQGNSKTRAKIRSACSAKTFCRSSWPTLQVSYFRSKVSKILRMINQSFWYNHCIVDW